MDSWYQNLEREREDIWRYGPLFDLDVSAQTRVSLGDQRARYDRLVSPMEGLDELVLQREDLNPNGSHKDRSLAVQVSSYVEEGHSELCISSSGNAAIAAAAASLKAGVTLYVFVSPRTRPAKVARILERGAKVVVSDRAIGLCREVSAQAGIPNLRPSVDNRALEGYKGLAYSLAEQEDVSVDSVFCYTTSGSTLCGMWRGFTALKEQGWDGSPPGLHAAQAGEITRVAEAFGEEPAQKEKSVIGDLGAKRTRRFGELVRAIRASGGHAWALSDTAILGAKSWLEERDIPTCLESACALAAAFEAVARGRVKRPLVLLTGHVSHDDDIPFPSVGVVNAETVDEWTTHFRGATP